MLKKSLLIALGALLAQGAMADVLSPEEALLRASSQNGSRRLVSTSIQPRLAYTAKTLKGEPAVYIFNQGNKATLVSASDKAIPVLGYLDSGEFDPDNMPPQLQYWLEEYAAQIAYAEENAITPKTTDLTVTYPSNWTYISPLCHTKWDQNKPFNDDLAQSNFATGCVATAMAQVMKYHNYPEIGRGTNSYTDYYGNTYSMDFGEKPFDWANMINDYNGQYTPEEASAVAYLMKACGYGANMSYGSQSGTQAQAAAEALIKYFNYDATLESLQRFQYTHSEWATILYEQLKNVGPVLYHGESLGGYAHAFVADGYDGMGYFHINWGWGGLCDGYYSIDAMIPTVQGTGGSQYGGYNFSQGMLVNIKPATSGSEYSPEAEFTLLGNMKGANSGAVLTLAMSEARPGNIMNSSVVSINPVLGIHIEGVENGQTADKEVSGVYFGGVLTKMPEFIPGSYINYPLSVLARFDSSLPDGKYKVQLVWKNGSNDKSWHNFVIANGCHDYVFVTKAGGKYTVESLPIESIKIEQAELLTPLYMRNPCEIRFTVSNPYDTELTQSVIPVLLDVKDRTLSFEGDSQLVTVGPKETTTITVSYTFSTVKGGSTPSLSEPREYILGAYDYNRLIDTYYQTGEFRESYYGDLGNVTMKRPGNNSKIAMRNISIANAVEEELMDGIGKVVGINEFSNIPVDVTIYGQTGFVASPLSAVIYEIDPKTGENLNIVYEKNFENLIYVEEGQTATASTVIRMSDFDVSKLYKIQIYYFQTSRVSLGTVRFAAASGVGEISSEESLNVAYDGTTVTASSQNGISFLTVYDMSGKVVDSQTFNGVSSTSLDASPLAGGVYIIKATDTLGNNRVIKIVVR